MIRFTVGAYSVDVESYQWGYKAGTAYVERSFGVTPAGVLYRGKAGTTSRVLSVRFAQSDVTLSLLRQLAIEASRTGQRVQFFPDTLTLGVFRWIDWSEITTVTHSEEGRLVTELMLIEQAA